MDQRLVVKFNGGREGRNLQPVSTLTIADLSTVSGKLKGYDALVNIVLDDAVEHIDLPDGSSTTREFGLLVCKGTAVMVVYPELGTEEIANPWAEGNN